MGLVNVGYWPILLKNSFSGQQVTYYWLISSDLSICKQKNTWFLISNAERPKAHQSKPGKHL